MSGAKTFTYRLYEKVQEHLKECRITEWIGSGLGAPGYWYDVDVTEGRYAFMKFVGVKTDTKAKLL